MGRIAIRAGDLLFPGAKALRDLDMRHIQTVRTGEIETLTSARPIVFNGLLIEMQSRGNIHLSKLPYGHELPVMDIAKYASGSTEIHPAALKSSPRQGSGSFIWLRQTRPYIGHHRAAGSGNHGIAPMRQQGQSTSADIYIIKSFDSRICADGESLMRHFRIHIIRQRAKLHEDSQSGRKRYSPILDSAPWREIAL